MFIADQLPSQDYETRPIGISELISAGYLDLGVASIQLRPHRNASVISNIGRLGVPDSGTS